MATGIYTTYKKDKSLYYRASLTYRGKHISLGSSDDYDFAQAIYTEASQLLNNSDITIDNYTEHIQALSFEKAICLLNFRDQGIYIKNPIYLRKGYFSYYLRKDYDLKFDNDDLFYYSQHKIQLRGNHMFVSDYGMQYSIANRYGIKNYAVCGRDYIFVNGDSSDYRYANIQIINTYHGVSSFQKNGRTWYMAKIHLHGDVIIGKYTSSIKAATAYNKAVDLAKKNGYNKSFPQNYILELSAKEYADLYSKIRLSDGFLSYFEL